MQATRRLFAALVLAAPLLAFGAGGAQAAGGTLRIGLNDDPNLLDPARSQAYTDRIVFAAMCDRLIDTDAHMDFVPQLATGWEWSPDNLSLTLHLRQGVHFQDGTLMDAAAVKTNLDRYRTAPESFRKSELKPVKDVEVVDPSTVRIILSAPYAPLLALLADRSGMMMSPKAIAAEGKDLFQHPVCAGPFTLAERVVQDHIRLDRFPGYWDAGKIALDHIRYQVIPDTTVRLQNLEAGAVDMIERMAPTDAAAVKANPHLRLAAVPSIAYRTILFNVANGPAAKTPLGQDARVRQAFAKSIDRGVLNQVAMDGQFIPNNQTEVPGSRYWDPAHPAPARDVAGAKALLKAAGQDRVKFTLAVANNPVDGQIGQVIQSMAAEAGFDITLRQVESNAGADANRRGDFQAALQTWSGRADPDANISIWMSCDGFVNFGHYCNPQMDALLKEGRSVTDVAKRVPIYRKVVDTYLTDMPQVILYNYTWLYGLSDRVKGFVPTPDGIIRPQGISLANP
jgi:peptide/nickel transport system substrate-binding protein